MNEIQEQEIPPKTKEDTSAADLQTTTPLFRKRKIEGTCPSPYNPSGMTPKMDPATPLLKNGFDGVQNRMDMNKFLGAKSPKHEEEKKKLPKQQMNPFEKFEMMQNNRKDKKQQNTMNFGGDFIKSSGLRHEEPIGLDQNRGVLKADQIINYKGASEFANPRKIQDAMEGNFESKQALKDIHMTPKTNLKVLPVKLEVSDSIVNIKDDLLNE